jgi:hypothetical protein
MSVYMYAICRAEADVPREVLGFDDAPLRMVRTDPLAALVSERTDTTHAADEDALWQHERVVEALMAAHDLLPARFGTELASDSAVADLLIARADEFCAALAHVAGAAELGVRAAWNGGPGPGDERSGGEYFAERIGIHQRVRALADRVEHALSPLARAHRIRMTPPASAAVSAAFLVTRERIEEFVRRTAALDAELDDGHVFCTGPWPPYSFSDAGAAAR